MKVPIPPKGTGLADKMKAELVDIGDSFEWYGATQQTIHSTARWVFKNSGFITARSSGNGAYRIWRIK